MAEYKLRKGGKEFAATKIETLVDLAGRGLLSPEDPVSVDGGVFQPAREIDVLLEAMESASTAQPAEADEVWRLLSAENVEKQAEGDDHVLASFLGEVEMADASASNPNLKPLPGGRASGPIVLPRAKPSHVVRAERSASGFPGGLGAVISTPSRRRVPKPEDVLPMVEPEPLDDMEEVATLPQDSISAAPVRQDPPTPPRKASAQDLPVSFTDWLEKRDAGDEASPLTGFGRYDDGIFVPDVTKAGAVNWYRVAAIGVLIVLVVGFRYLWITTVAEAEYPHESELIAARAPPPPPGGAAGALVAIDQPGLPQDMGLSPIEAARAAREREMRGALQASAIISFSTSEELEDALFMELSRARQAPQSVSLESLRERGSQDRDHRRPTQANVKIVLGGVSTGGDEGYDEVADKVMFVWLLIGKYQAQGKLQFEDVDVSIGEPIPFGVRRTGRPLASFWERQVLFDELFDEGN